jgi:hypothetical protein
VTPPEIRYPLPTLVALIVLVLLARYAASATRPLRTALEAHWTRIVEGPPVPSSPEPQVVAGPFVRRVLLLRDGVGASARPGGSVVETIGRRMFADVYDVWPLTGAPQFYRIGNRHAFGWVPAADVLPWNTRLVLKGERRGEPARPVLGMKDGQIEIAIWDPDHPWEKVAYVESTDASTLPDDAWGVLLSREELIGLLRQLMSKNEVPASLRLRAVLGRLGSAPAFTASDIQAARRALPAQAFRDGELPPETAIERLSRINESWNAEAAWSSLSFQRVPLDGLP